MALWRDYVLTRRIDVKSSYRNNSACKRYHKVIYAVFGSYRNFKKLPMISEGL